MLVLLKKWSDQLGVIKMLQEDNPKKRFLAIVQQLREIIRQQNIEAGGKLPSERVLSEQLQVGRSSVREALRSLELLGLIETKHGGGTFLSTSPQNKLVEVLATFLLDKRQSVEDVHLTRRMHEREALHIVCNSAQLRALPVWQSLFIQLEVKENIAREDVIREIMIASGNRLSLRIWFQLNAYSGKPFQGQVTAQEKLTVLTLLQAIQLGYEDDALQAYAQWLVFLQREYAQRKGKGDL